MTYGRWATALLGLLVAVPCASQEEEFAERAREIERSVVRITSRGYARGGEFTTLQGTGFVVAPRGYILTAAHVLEPTDGWEPNRSLQREIEALNEDGGVSPIDGMPVVLYLDPQTDLALLRMMGFDRPALTLGNSTYLRDGDFLGVMAFGEGRTRPWIGEGSIETVFQPAVRGFMDLVLQNLRPTDSGSPLFDARGHVVGVLLMGWENLPESSEYFGVPVNSAAPILSMAGRNHPATLLEWLDETPEFDRKIEQLEEAILDLKTSWTFELKLREISEGELQLQMLIRKPLAQGFWPQKVTLEIVPVVLVSARNNRFSELALLSLDDYLVTYAPTDPQETQLYPVNNLRSLVQVKAEDQGIQYERISRFEVQIEAKIDIDGEEITRREKQIVYP